MGIIENRYEGIDKYAIWFIKRKAKQLVGQAGFTEAVVSRNTIPDFFWEIFRTTAMIKFVRSQPTFN